MQCLVIAGNTDGDSCQEAPADVRSSIAVGASDLTFKFNASEGTQTGNEPIYPYSNTGACLDIFAPGVNILAACGSASEHLIPHTVSLLLVLTDLSTACVAQNTQEPLDIAA